LAANPSALPGAWQQGRFAEELRQPGLDSESLGPAEGCLALLKKVESLALELGDKDSLQKSHVQLGE
jgi:hypothetical protein